MFPCEILDSLIEEKQYNFKPDFEDGWLGNIRDHNYEITLLFFNNGFITLTAEIIEVVLEDQKTVND